MDTLRIEERLNALEKAVEQLKGKLAATPGSELARAEAGMGQAMPVLLAHRRCSRNPETSLEFPESELFGKVDWRTPTPDSVGRGPAGSPRLAATRSTNSERCFG